MVKSFSQGSTITFQSSMSDSCALIDQQQLPLDRNIASIVLAYNPDDEDENENEDEDELDDLDDDDDDDADDEEDDEEDDEFFLDDDEDDDDTYEDDEEDDDDDDDENEDSLDINMDDD